MRKITSKYKEEKRNKKRQMIIAVIFALLLLLSILGYSFTTTGRERINYNGFYFEKQNNLWLTNLNGVSWTFTYSPEEVEGLHGDFNGIGDYYGKPLYVSSDDYNAEVEIYRNLDNVVLRRQYACLQGEECENENFPVKTCTDNFIIIIESEVNEVRQEENCVFFKGNTEELIKEIDAYLLKIIGIQ